MARLSRLRTGPAPLGHRLDFAAPPERLGRRTEGRQWYGTQRWRRLRWQVLVRDLFTCRKCGRVEADTSQLVADHIDPHRGDEALFWNEANLQCLCKACHDSAKQREEAASRR